MERRKMSEFLFFIGSIEFFKAQRSQEIIDPFQLRRVIIFCCIQHISYSFEVFINNFLIAAVDFQRDFTNIRQLGMEQPYTHFNIGIAIIRKALKDIHQVLIIDGRKILNSVHCDETDSRPVGEIYLF